MGPENSTTTRITIVLAFVGLIPRLLPAQNDPQRVADTKISIDSGFQTESIEIDLTTATQDAVILYTTDGREPDPGNIFSGPIGEVYAEPIFIDRTTILRVKAFKTGDLLPTNIDTRTYLFPQDVVDQPADIEGWPRPVLSTGQGTARHDYEMDPRVVGEDEQREAMIQSLMALPTMSLVVDPTTIWDATGKGGFYRGDTEEAVHVEILYPDTPGKTEHARGAVQGHSHDRLKRSLRLKFKTEFGDSKFRTDLLKKALHRPGDAPDRFDRLILRAGNNRSWARSWNPDKTAYTMDEWYRATQIAMSGYGARGAFVHLYLNGLYWGLYNLTERPDRWFTSEHFGGEVEDWFAISHGGDQGGNSDPWDQLLTAARADLSQSDAYEEVRSRLDLSGFIDYLLLSWYINVTDWPRNNWWAGIQTEPSGRARFFAWDGEWSFGLGESPGTAWVHPDFRSTSRGGSAPTSVLWNALKKNADFMILVADRAHRHLLTPGGALSDAPSRERWQRLNQTIESAVLAESARWGDALSPERPRTVENDWRREVDRIDSLLQGNSSRLIDRLVEQDYYPDLEPPRISLESGLISPGRPIEVTNPNNKGTIYYTTDGSDPRSPGGGLSTTASEYEAPLQTGSGLHLRLRVLQKSIFGNETWTALVERSFYSEIPSLRVSELMYHPAAPTEAESIAGFTNDDDFEFLELINTGTTSIDLGGMRFVDGISLTFPADTFLAPGRVGVIVSNRLAFIERYGEDPPILSEYERQLSNSGERLEMRGPFEEPVFDFAYDDEWQPTTDGDGFSLEIVDLAADPATWGDPTQWRSGPMRNGTPGNTVAGRPTIEARTLGSRRFEIRISGQPEARYTMESSPDLKTWFPASILTTNELGTGFQRVEIPVDQPGPVYYRARKENLLEMEE